MKQRGKPLYQDHSEAPVILKPPPLLPSLFPNWYIYGVCTWQNDPKSASHT